MKTSLTRMICALAFGTALIASFQEARAQAITTSSIRGTIVSDDGNPVPSASVTVTHEPTGSAYTATSRADGSFSLRGLRPGGPYTLVSESAGLVSTQRREVYLDLDRPLDVTLQMKTEEVVQMEAYEVTGDPMDALFDSSQTGSGSYLSSQDIGELPAGDRSINALARLDPRISYNRDPFDRAISVSGLSNRFNSIQVDGVSASDPFGLNANNTAAERNVIPLDSLEALTVSTSPYDPRKAGFVGAQINAITKSGGNEFKGSLFYTYRGRSALSGVEMVGQELDGSAFLLGDFSEQTIGGTISGPIIPDKLFFAVSYEDVKEDRIPPSPFRTVDTALLTQITTALSSLGFEPGSPNPPAANELTDENIMVKLDWVINGNHRATFRYQDVESSRPTFSGFGTGNAQNNFSYDSHWYDQSVKNTSYIGQLISSWNDKLNTEFSLSRSNYDSMPVNSTTQPQVQIRNVPVAGSTTSFIMFGTERSRHANILQVETDTAELFGSYELADTHTLEFGFQYDMADIYNLFVQDALGRYEFNNIAELQAVAANNNGTVQYRLYAFNEIISGVNPAAEFKESNLGLFINDVWRVNPRLTVNFGLRMDIAGLPDDVPFNQSFFNTFGVRNDHTYDGERVLQPRVGFNWQPDAKKRTVVRGGVGLFYGRAPRVWVSNSYSNTGSNFRSYSAGSAAGGSPPLQAPAVSANPGSQPTTGSAPPAQQVAFIDESFQLPSRWKANIAVERALGFWDLKLTAEYEKTWVRKDIFYSNVNIATTRTAGDGRELFFNAYGATASGTRLVNTGFTNRIIKLSNSEDGGTDTFTLSLERPRTPDGWFWRLAYVNNHASEVLFGTSSVAASNWNNRSVFNTNSQEEHRSELEIRHKFMGMLTKEIELIKGFKTTFSLFYEGRSGYPYSLVTNGDINGDGLTTNDLAYIPMRGGDPLVRFATPADQDRFFQIVDRLGLVEGQPVSATNQRYPWVNQFDFSVKQQVKLPGWRHRLVLGLDILNVGNLLNDEWGIIRGSNQFFVKRENIANATYDGVNNQYVYSNVSTALASGNDFAPSLGRGEPAASRWTAMLSVRYEF